MIAARKGAFSCGVGLLIFKSKLASGLSGRSRRSTGLMLTAEHVPDSELNVILADMCSLRMRAESCRFQ